MRNFLLNTLTRHVGTQPHPILQLNGVACLMMRKRNPIGCSSASRDDNAVAISLQTPSRDPSESHRTTRTRQEESNQEEPDDAASLTNHKVIVRRQPASTNGENSPFTGTPTTSNQEPHLSGSHHWMSEGAGGRPTASALPHYLLDLIARVTTISVRAQKITDLPVEP